MRYAFSVPFIASFTLAFAISAQNVRAQNPQNPPASPQPPTQSRSPGGDVGSGGIVTADLGGGIGGDTSAG